MQDPHDCCISPKSSHADIRTVGVFIIDLAKPLITELPTSCMAQKFYEELAFYYDFICEDRKQDVDVLRTLIKTHKQSKENKLLDVACGTGREDYYLKEYFHVTGIDVHEGVLALAQKRNPDIHYIRADMSSFTLNTTVDVITCFDALNYMPTLTDLKKTLKTFYNHLNKGGVLIFYIDSLKEHFKEKTLITKKSKRALHVTLIEDSYLRGNNREECYLIFVVRDRDTSNLFYDTHWLTLFQLHDIESLVKNTGFNLFLYESDPKFTFSVKKYTKKDVSPVFVCVK